MRHYRAYAIGSDGHFAGVHDIECEDDAAAIEISRTFVNGRDIELFEQARFVVRLASQDPAQD